ncbi:2846_t:CDS:2, partial [Dentiscutata heterogama]
QVTPLNIRSFIRDEGCENVHYPPEILAPLPYLEKCLSTIKGSAVYPNDPQYYDCIRVANCRNPYFPVVVVYVAEILDIQKSIHCANSLNISVVARSGGHSFEGYGDGGKNGAMVIDVQGFNQIDINTETKTVVIGTGNRLGPVYYKLYQAGFLIPAGSCANVGIGGHATGGGFGVVARKYGLASDNIISAEMVIANGTFISPINSTHHSDLFFVLRGAGNAGYGIITSLTFRIHPIQPIVTSINISYYSEQVELVFMSLSKVSKNLSENLTPYLAVLAESSGYYTISITATYLGPAEEARIAVKELIELSNPAYIKFEEMTWWRSVMETFTQQQTIHPVFPPQPFKSTSYNIPLPGLSREGIRFLVNFISNVECTTVALFDVYAGGGVINRISGNNSAYIHRNLLFVLQLEMKLSDRDKETQIKCVEKHLQFRQEFQAKYTSYFSYQDYIDKDLPDWATRYYGVHLPRLIETKKKYDPNNLFNWEQSIPTKLP